MDPRAGVPAGISGALTSSDGRPVDRDDDPRSESKAGRLARLYSVLTAVNRVVQLASDEGCRAAAPRVGAGPTRGTQRVTNRQRVASAGKLDQPKTISGVTAHIPPSGLAQLAESTR